MHDITGRALVVGGGGRSRAPGVLHGVRRRATVYAVVGVLNTGLYFALYNGLRAALEPIAANTFAVGASITFSFWANRRFTFQQVGSEGSMRQFLEFAFMFALTLLLSNAMLAVVLAVRPDTGLVMENVALVGASAVMVVARFWFMQAWIFRPDRRRSAAR